ncbi:MAG: hypothetical protein KJO29_14075, partial [Bacteroidia bacterium]|nr:hypothetical protein [Bacteroidia bacterium]
MSAQSPHGEGNVVDCASCHDPSGWTIDIDTFHFNHDTFSFRLNGLHASTDCKLCHVTLVFNETENDCASCHDDIHNMTLGNDCRRCHNEESWLVNQIPEIHEMAGFPLVGAHSAIHCNACHISDSELSFPQLGNECLNCHLREFEEADDPDHSGFSTNCIDCHDPATPDWTGGSILHDFFPLTLGHDISDCARCHNVADYTDISSECASCHQQDYDNTVNPDHNLTGLSTDCASCHTTEPEWRPAEFRDHDGLYFPIYTGSHQGEWDQCLDCHLNQNDFSEFSCTNCHEKDETDGEHEEVNGYFYDDGACLACHPDGGEGSAFDHNQTNFSLTGAHLSVACMDCHFDGFAGTSSYCADCHTPDFEASVNPDHVELNLSNDCASCHTTDPEWMPATFDIHNDFYPLSGAHLMIANDCASCHNGDYNNTPNTCFDCHKTEYEETTDPDHVSANFGEDCAGCHSEDGWVPSTFDHDGQYFPIFS